MAVVVLTKQMRGAVEHVAVKGKAIYDFLSVKSRLFRVKRWRDNPTISAQTLFGTITGGRTRRQGGGGPAFRYRGLGKWQGIRISKKKANGKASGMAQPLGKLSV
jgi:hypothetical protein